MSTEIIERIKKEIASLDSVVTTTEIGLVTNVGDGIATIDGLRSAQMMEMVVFSPDQGATLEALLSNTDTLYGLVLNLEEDSVKVVILGDASQAYEGMKVYRTKQLLSIPVSEDIVGRVVNPLGEAIDGKPAIVGKKNMPIERVAYGVMERSGVNEPVYTCSNWSWSA